MAIQFQNVKAYTGLETWAVNRPMTVSFWYYMPNPAPNSQIYTLLAFQDSVTSSQSNRSQINIYGGATFISETAGTTTVGTSTYDTSYRYDVWEQSVVQFRSNTSRRVRTTNSFGGAWQENTSNVSPNLGADTYFSINYINFPNAGQRIGYLAELGVWDVELSEDECVALQKGYSCHLIRPESLRIHLPAIRSQIEPSTDGSMTFTGSTVPAGTHPPIIGAIA